MNAPMNAHVKIVASRVPDDSRMDFLPHYFGGAMLLAEACVYKLAEEQSGDYKGGLWDFFELTNGGAFMAPSSPDVLLLSVRTNGYVGELSREAAGIVWTLFALSHLSFRFPDAAELLSQRYYQLRDYALDHPEARAILAAMD